MGYSIIITKMDTIKIIFWEKYIINEVENILGSSERRRYKDLNESFKVIGIHYKKSKIFKPIDGEENNIKVMKAEKTVLI